MPYSFGRILSTLVIETSDIDIDSRTSFINLASILSHTTVPDGKIIFQYRTTEVETGELYGNQMSIYFFELPRVMRLTKNFESPVAGWCGIFRNITNFVTLRNGDYGHFQRVVEAMTIRSLSEQEIKEYFSDMMTLEDMEPTSKADTNLATVKVWPKGLRKARKKKSHLSKVCIRPEFQRKSSHPPPDRVLNIFRKYLK